jgi:hypothetical protein
LILLLVLLRGISLGFALIRIDVECHSYLMTVLERLALSGRGSETTGLPRSPHI